MKFRKGAPPVPKSLAKSKSGVNKFATPGGAREDMRDEVGSTSLGYDTSVFSNIGLKPPGD